MRVMDVVNEAKGAMRVSEVFGTPYEKNGITIIPAARIPAVRAVVVTKVSRPAAQVSAYPPGRSVPS